MTLLLILLVLLALVAPLYRVWAAMQTVNKCRLAQPLIAAKSKATRLLTAPNQQASAQGESDLIVRVIANHGTTTVINKRLNQPR